MVYRDRTFCSSDCTQTMCYRYFGEEEQKKANEWWGKPGAPVAFSDFSKDCKDYAQPK